MKPMLARTLGPRFSHYPCFIQPKLNGIRALYQTGNFTSRDEILWHSKVLAHLSSQLALLSDQIGSSILDGELYVHGWRLQRINSAVAVKRSEPTKDTPRIEFHVFDVVDPNRSFSERWFDTYHLLQQAELPNIKAVATSHVGSAGDTELHFHNYVRQGYEGIMLRPDGPYVFGQHEGRNGNLTEWRSQYLWKYKSWQDGEFVCVGVTEGEGKANIGIGALTCEAKRRGKVTDQFGEFVEWTNPLRFNVGTGFSDEERIEYMNNPPIGKLIKVRYLELTKAGIPFNPSFLAVLD